MKAGVTFSAREYDMKTKIQDADTICTVGDETEAFEQTGIDVADVLDAARASGRVLTEARGSAKLANGVWRWVLRRLDPRDLRSHLNALDEAERAMVRHRAEAMALENRRKAATVKSAETRATNEARKARKADHDAQMERVTDLIEVRKLRVATRQAAEDTRAQTLDNDERAASIAHQAWEDECRRAIGDILLGAMARAAHSRPPLSVSDMDQLVDEAMGAFFTTVNGRVTRIGPPRLA
jgi:hypothetical protein